MSKANNTIRETSRDDLTMEIKTTDPAGVNLSEKKDDISNNKKNTSAVISSMLTVGGYTLLYRFSSILRDMVIATIMGAGVLTDAFAVIFKLANVLRKVFSEGAFNASFLPKFSYTFKEKGRESAELLASQVFTWLILVLSIASVICVWQFPALMSVYAPKFVGTEKMHYAVELGRISFPYITLSFTVALFSGVLNSINKFAVPTGSHLILNALVIISLFCGTSALWTSAHNVALAVALAGIVQTILLWLNSLHNGFRIGLTSKLISSDVKEIFVKMIPGAVGAGVWQINMLVDVCMASQLATGCVSYLYYMDHMNQFPLGILGISLSTGLLPFITNSFKEQKYGNASYQINRGLVFSIAVSLPITTISLFIPETLTSLFYEGGRFTHTDVVNAAPCLCAFALGLPAYTLTKLCSTAFFAQKNTRVPLVSGIISILVNYVFILVLSPKLLHTGIALATTIAAWFNGLYLYICLIRQGKVTIFSRTIVKILKQIVLSSCVGAIAYFINGELSPFYTSKLKSVALILSMLGFCSLLFYWIGKKTSCFNEDNTQL